MNNPAAFHHAMSLEYEEFAEELKNLASLGLSDDALTALVREVMGDADEQRIDIMLAQWGKDVAFEVMDWGMFWNCPGVTQALPYFQHLSEKEQKILVYRAVAEGQCTVLEQALPILNGEDHWKIIGETFAWCPQMAHLVYTCCEPVSVIAHLSDNGDSAAAQWVENLYRPIHEKQLLTDATAFNGAPQQRKKI